MMDESRNPNPLLKVEEAEEVTMTVEERLERLERQNRRMKKGFALLALALAGFVTMGQVSRQSVPELISAKKFYVVNDKGQTMVELGSTRLFGYLFVSNRKGRVIATISTNHSGDGMIRTIDSKGRPLVIITSKKNGEGFIATMKRGEMTKGQP
ncbi:MAG: hypothetical protein V3U53_03400 [bacterium]